MMNLPSDTVPPVSMKLCQTMMAVQDFKSMHRTVFIVKLVISRNPVRISIGSPQRVPVVLTIPICNPLNSNRKRRPQWPPFLLSLYHFILRSNDQANSFRILNFDFFDRKLLPKNKFDVVFLDPPYELMKASKIFLRLKELRVTKINSLIIYECNKELEKMDGFEILRSRKIGKTYLNFFKGFNE